MHGQKNIKKKKDDTVSPTLHLHTHLL